jgi:cystathionine beta-lyase
MTGPLRSLDLGRLRRRTSLKWRAYAPDVLPLWVAEMDVPLAPGVVVALCEATAAGDTGYATGTDYAEALAQFSGKRWDWDFGVEQTAMVPDVMLGIVEVLRLVTAPGDAVVVNPPVYPPFSAFLRHMDRRVLEAPLRADPGGGVARLDLAALGEAMRRARSGGRTAAYLLCSPHNPTGTVHTTAELTAVAELAREYDVRVVADEIHAPLVYEAASQRPFLSVPGAENAFALLSASKAWNLAGVKAAIAVAGTQAVDDLRRLPAEVDHGVSHLGVVAHTAAFRDDTGWLDDLLVDLDANRRLLTDLLATSLPEVGYRQPEGTYLAWLDCTGLGLGADPAAAFLEHGRVALSRGSDFGTDGDGHVRLNLATSPEIVTEAVHRMAETVRRIHSR